jgi:hypothetical protein
LEIVLSTIIKDAEGMVAMIVSVLPFLPHHPKLGACGMH